MRSAKFLAVEQRVVKQDVRAKNKSSLLRKIVVCPLFPITEIGKHKGCEMSGALYSLFEFLRRSASDIQSEMKKVTKIAIGTFLISIGVAYAGGALSVTGKEIHDKQRGLGISFSIKNNGNAPLSVIEDELPWGWRYSTLVIVAEPSGTTLNSDLPVVEPNPGKLVKLQPKQSLVGNIYLKERFPSFEEKLEKTDLVVFWTFLPGFSFGEISEGQSAAGGWFLVKARKK